MRNRITYNVELQSKGGAETYSFSITPLQLLHLNRRIIIFKLVFDLKLEMVMTRSYSISVMDQYARRIVTGKHIFAYLKDLQTVSTNCTYQLLSGLDSAG